MRQLAEANRRVNAPGKRFLEEGYLPASIPFVGLDGAFSRTTNFSEDSSPPGNRLRLVIEALRGTIAARATSMITEKAFRRYINQSKPFEIYLNDRRSIRVPHGEHVSIEPGGRTFLFWQPDGGFELFNLTMVTSVKAGVNGREQ